MYFRKNLGYFTSKVRAIAVGFGLSAFFMMHFFERFYRWFANTGPRSFLFNLQVSTPSFGNIAGAYVFFPIVFTLICLMAGFFLASFYPVIEDSMVSYAIRFFEQKRDIIKVRKQVETN